MLARRLLSSSIVNTVALCASIASSIILLPFLIAHLGDKWYAIWVLIGTILGYFTILDIGLFSAAERYIAFYYAKGDWHEVNAVITVSLVLFSVAGAIALVSICLGAMAVPWMIIDPRDAEIIRTALLIASIDAALFFPGGVFNGVIVAHLRYDLAGLLQIAKIIIRTLLILYFIEEGYSIVALAAITLMTNTIERAAKVWLAVRLYPNLQLSIGLFTWARVRQYVDYGIFSFLVEAADKARFYADNAIIALFLSLSAVTTYNIALRLAHYYIQIVNGGINYLLPVFSSFIAQDDQHALRKSFLITSKIAVLASILVGGCVIIVAKPFIASWIGPEYAGAAIPTSILVVGIAFELAQLPSSNLLFALKAQRFLAKLSGAEAAANMALSLVLVGPLGMTGVALGTAIPLIAFRTVLQPRYVCRQIDVDLWRYTSVVCAIGIGSVAMQFPVWVVTRTLWDLSLMWTMVVLVLAYPVILWASIRLYFDGPERQVMLSAGRALLPQWQSHWSSRMRRKKGILTSKRFGIAMSGRGRGVAIMDPPL